MFLNYIFILSQLKAQNTLKVLCLQGRMTPVQTSRASIDKSNCLVKDHHLIISFLYIRKKKSPDLNSCFWK